MWLHHRSGPGSTTTPRQRWSTHIRLPEDVAPPPLSGIQRRRRTTAAAPAAKAAFREEDAGDDETGTTSAAATRSILGPSTVCSATVRASRAARASGEVCAHAAAYTTTREK